MSWLFYQWFLVSGISLFVKDSQSLFLRHVQSGKCIKAGELIYDTGGYSLPFWALMTENCLNVSAQFRYLDSEILYNIEKGGTFVSPAKKNENYKGRLVVYKGIAAGGKRFQDSDRNRLKQRATGTLYFYDKREERCAETSQTENYVKGVFSCGGKTEQNFTFGAVTEYNARMENVGCSKIQHMVIQTADYGNYDNSGAFNNNAATDTQCSKLTNCQVKSLCGGKRSCELTMNNNLLASQYCSDTSKQIYTKYTCVDTYSSSAITAAHNIRLTKQNAGFIEMKNGSIWRKVVEENWDMNRQKMLCQHLGFEEIEGNKTEIKQLEIAQQIATGDLICYNETSCCVHLEPSTSTTSTRFPYVRCKICNHPLLHNASTFPDSVFSGSGDSSSKYIDARITKGGWCPSGSGSRYLLLDLQKEYHITGVVVMADKAQTRWSGSYSLKYSRDTSYENTVVISRNQNGYQASRTSLDIYNVRYVKVESTGNQDFCLRIELCGEVQTPAPVSNIDVSPSTYSANVTWQISTSSQDSSYITKIIVYLNGQKHTTISRGTEVTIDGLLPYTWYTVEIQTQDGYLQRSKNVSKTFWTNKAGHSGPPLDVTLKSRGKTSLDVSWNVPDENLQNSELTGYQVCFYTRGTTLECLVVQSSKVLSLTLNNLQPSTKYYVTVSAITKAGYGEKSLEVSKITNGEAINPFTMSYYTLSLSIPKQEDYIREVMVIVENSIRSAAGSENLRTSDLKPYQKNIKGPYVTAYIKSDVLPLTFVIGDGREFSSEDEKYFNHPLKQNSKYIVFLRFFENQNSYYSTEWSDNVTTMMKPAVESEIAKQSNREEIRIDLLIPLVILVACFLLSLGVNIHQRRLIQSSIGQKCRKCEASKHEQQIKKFNSLSNSKRTKDIKTSPEDQSNIINNEAVYELPDSECTEQNQLEAEISTGKESSTYVSLKDDKEPENVYQSLQPKKDNIAAVEYENPAFAY